MKSCVALRPSQNTVILVTLQYTSYRETHSSVFRKSRTSFVTVPFGQRESAVSHKVSQFDSWAWLSLFSRYLLRCAFSGHITIAALLIMDPVRSCNQLQLSQLAKPVTLWWKSDMFGGSAGTYRARCARRIPLSARSPPSRRTDYFGACRAFLLFLW